MAGKVAKPAAALSLDLKRLEAVMPLHGALFWMERCGARLWDVSERLAGVESAA
jgi:hypothetical protein